jgi:pimeloyl-ACP methyl ester carboxylesterase
VQTDILLDVNGGTIFARRWQPAAVYSPVPLVLLHDSLGCVDLWRDFPATLAHRLGRAVVAYDRLGFGRSSPREELPSADFIREEAEEVFPAVLGRLGIAEFAAFGHSVGGAMALVAASRAGDRCKAVVSESAQAFVEDRTVAGVRAARAQFERPEQFERLRRWHGEKARWVLDAWTEVWLSPGFASWTLGPDLPRVRCPVLLIHGDQDEYGSVQFPAFIRDRVGGPAEMHVLGGCGHVPHRERPDEVIELVARFPPLAPPSQDDTRPGDQPPWARSQRQ